MNNIDVLNRYFLENAAKGTIDKDIAVQVLKELNGKEQQNTDIAIIGMSCRFPGANSKDDYWQNLINGRQCIYEFPNKRKMDLEDYLKSMGITENINDLFVKAGYLDEIDKFDPAFFRISPQEAKTMDPIQRLFLETAWEAIEDAGYGGNRIYGTKTGVYAGRDHSFDHIYKHMNHNMDPLNVTGSLTGILASRLAYIFDLQGPSMVIDTACSSGLVALHQACCSLRNKECQLAIAGGIHIAIEPSRKQSSMGMIESSDYSVRAFDKGANGTVWGEGVGVVFLKPLNEAIADRDNIYAVIKGSAVNNDGASNGITAPNPEAQERVILSAWKQARIEPETISYIECHGTGTELGDPIEIKGLVKAFGRYTSKRQFCGIGSVKPNIGHSVAASGMASLFKVVFSLKNRVIPKTINFSEANPLIDFSNSPVYVNDKLTEWKTEKGVRRTGVSAFGFSGTNCHMVLEEAPNYLDESEDSSRYNVLALSAKKRELLIEIMEKYRSFLSKSVSVNIGDLCFTANTGRGHYNWRAIIKFKDIEELVLKINKMCENPFEISGDDNIYFGEHKVIQSCDELEQGLITEKDKRKYTKEASEKLNEYISSKKEKDDILHEICELYIKGADIQWDELYKDRNFRKLSLPTYPLERVRCWIDPFNTIETKPKGQSKKEIAHPLFERRISNSLEFDTYLTELSPEKYWILNEHKIFGKHSIPGVTYLEMAREVGKRYFPDGNIELRDVIFLALLVVEEDEKKEVQTVVKKQKDFLEFYITSKKNPEKFGMDEIWVKHAEGKIYANYDSNIMTCNLEKKLSNCKQVDLHNAKTNGEIHKWEVGANELLKVLDVGPRWNNLKRAYHISTNEVIVKIELPNEFKSDLEEYFLHPALLDHGVNTAAFTIANGMFLPFSYKKMKIYSKMPSSFYSYFKKSGNETDGAETITFDVLMMDESGNVFLEIEDYSIKRVHNAQNGLKKLVGNGSTYFELEWIPEKIDESNLFLRYEKILVFKSLNILSQVIIDQLRTQYGVKIIEVEFGDKYKCLNSDNYIISNLEGDYLRLLNDVKDAVVTKIIHMSSFDNTQVEDLTTLEKKLDAGVYSLFFLLKAFANSGIKGNIELILVSDYVNNVVKQERMNPFNSPLFGLGRVAGIENNNLKCRCIDIDSTTQADDIIKELTARNSYYQVAYRKGTRYVEEFRIVEIENMLIRETARIKDNGVYLITGGTGGIGLEIAKYIALNNKVNIILLNRSRIPDRDQWEEILKDNKNSKAVKIIRTIVEIESRGSSVFCYSSNVCDIHRMEQIFLTIREKFGKIDGVIHCAGTAGNGFILSKDINEFQSVIEPKVIGAWLVDKLTAEDKLDFFIMFSSILSFLGQAGQGDYAAANAFLDGYSAYMKRLGKPALSINWPAWEEVGMAVEQGFINNDMIFKTISVEQGINIFDELMGMDTNRVVVGELNYEIIKAAEYNLDIRLSEQIKNEISMKSKPLSHNASNRDNTDNIVPLKITGRSDGQYSELEVKLANIWANEMGLESINLYDNFFELGGDSIIALKIINNINNCFKINSQIIDIFNSNCIKNYADYLEKEYLNSNRDIGCVIENVQESEYYVASPAQKRMFILNKLEGENTAYNLPTAMTLEGKLDLKKLQEVFDKLIIRHQSLRTSFEFINGKPVQKIQDKVEFEFGYEEYEERKYDELTSDFIKPFDISKAPLLRAHILKINAEKHIMLLDIHHIISDATSIGILLSEISNLYEGKILPKLNIQYKDFASWQIERLKTNGIIKQEQYWMEIFSGEVPVLNLPTDYPRPSMQSFEGDKISFELDEMLSKELKKLVSKTNSTMFITLLATLNLLLYKYTGQEDIVIGTTISGRSHIDLQGLIGLFVNTIPMRNRLKPDYKFAEFLEEIKDNTLKAYQNQDYQFDELVSKLNLKKDMSRNPLFDVMLILQDTSSLNTENSNLLLKPYKIERNVSKLDMTLEVIEWQGKIGFTLEYCTKLFKRETMERFGEHFINAIKTIVCCPDILIKDIDILTDREKKMIGELNHTKGIYNKNLLVHNMLEEQAQKRPDNIALVFGEQCLDYKSLNEKSNQLARVLTRKGIKQGDIVGILVNRSLEMIIGIMGIMKAGGAYMPLDPAYPKSRIDFMIKDSETEIVLTQSHIADQFDIRAELIFLDDKDLYEGDFSNLEVAGSPGDLAYVIYTSGSTGNPKGVMIEHKSIVNFINAIPEIIEFSPDKAIVALTTMSFDIFVLETLLPLAIGMKVVIANEDQQLNPKLLNELMITNSVSMLQATPSRMQMIISDEKGCSFLNSLKTIMIGGEAFPKALLEELRRRTKAKIYNMYGPTETTVWSTVKDLNGSDEINIGKPILNTVGYILDEHKNLQPVSIPGELYIAGDGLARGYLKRLELTSEKFVPNPFNPKSKMYKTGDLAKWNTGGEIEFIGRTDNQVKIRGYRIELGEIENLLVRHEYIKEAVVVEREDKNGEKSLYAYFVSEKDFSLQELREYLFNKLPDYMIPSYFMRIDELPYTPNGKVDRKALPEYKIYTERETEYVVPQNEVEEKMVSIWQDILGVDKIGVYDDFFELGGNSLLIIRLEVELEKYGFKIDSKDIIKYKTIRGISKPFHQEQNYKLELEDTVLGVSNWNATEEIEINNYASDSKTLCGIEPFNDIFYKNCFYNSTFPVLGFFGKDIFPILINDIIIYSYDETENGEKFNVKYIPSRNIEEILLEEGLSIEIKRSSKNIIDDIITALSKDRPVVIWVDCYYESIRTDMYMKTHWPHTLLIYGYDENAKKCEIIEHKHRDNLSYSKRNISFDDVIKCYQGFNENFGETMEIQDYYEFHVDKMKNLEVGSDCNSIKKKETIFADNMINKRKIIFNSLECLKRFCDEFTYLIESKENLYKNSGELLEVLNDVINAKTVEKYKIEKLYGSELPIYERINDILNRWKGIRAIIAKSVYSSIYNDTKMSAAIKSIKEIYYSECDFYIAYFEYLENIQNKREYRGGHYV